MNPTAICPALFVAAPASGQGKTTVTAALARRWRDGGRRVRVFKTGPDFIDPGILELASGAPVHQLDLWMGGPAHCARLLAAAARDADLILVEGVMGLFDGNPSGADLAMRFGLPVLAVIDGSAMAQTFGALALGLATYRPGLTIAGIFANRVSGERHARLLAAGLPPGLPFAGWLPREVAVAMPERHLGLVQAAEIADLDARIAGAAAALAEVPADWPPPVAFARPEPERAATPTPLAGARIAVARDLAFSFIYPANLDTLRALGAELVFFSPLADAALPAAEALYLPGGYPELHLEALSTNGAMLEAVRAHHAAGRPILAECGGMLYLAETLTDRQGRTARLAGLLPGRAAMGERLANLGWQEIRLPEGWLRGHAFHYSRFETELAPLAWSRGARPDSRGEPLWRIGRLQASYLHLYFPSNPAAAARLFAPGFELGAVQKQN